MEEYTTKQKLLDDDSEVVGRKRGQREQTSCCRLLYSGFVLVVVCALVVFTFMVLMDLFRLARHPSDGGDNKAAYLIFGEYKSEPGWRHSSRHPIPNHGSQMEHYDPPPFFEKAKRARYLVHHSEWVTLSTTSVHLKGTPFGIAQSVSDGPTSNATGVPYIYITTMATIMADVRANPVISMSFTEAQSEYCTKHSLDPESPRCARLCLTGKFVEVLKGSDEETFARTALFTRHPAMKGWPKSHDFIFMKLEVTNIWLLDFFGKGSEISVKDYFSASI